MQQLNNMDIAILVIVGISALIALGRGLVKEVLSIVGWVLAGAAVIYLLPILNPFTLKYIESGWMAGIATAAFILIVFMIVWIYATAGVVGKIRTRDDDDEPAAEQKSAETKKDKDKSDVDALFEKLAQPQIEKMREDRKKLQKIKEDFEGYNTYERDNLNRLIENTVE